MSHNAGGPNGPNVPPPPSGQGSGGSYGGPPPGGPQPGPGQPQPYGGAPDQGKKGGVSKLIIGLVAGGLVLLLLCCIGGWLLTRNSDEPGGGDTTTSSQTSESTPSEESPTGEESPTSDASPTSEDSPTAGGGDAAMPAEFDGWKKSDDNAGPSGAATYKKGNDFLIMTSTDDAPGAIEGLNSVWSNEQDVSGAKCGTLAGSTQCAKAQDGKIYIITQPDKQASEVAGNLGKFLDAL